MGDGVESSARRLFEVGRRAFPNIELDAERFVAHVRARAADAARVDALHGDDLYLACACAHGDPRALAAFEARHMIEIPLFVARTERGEAVVEEIKQLVRERLFVAHDDKRPKILEYSGRGALGGWLRVLTIRVASNRRRALAEAGRASFDESRSEIDALPAVDPELAIIKTRYRGEFNEALRAAFEGLSTRERLIFRMHFVDGLNIDRIGVVFHVHRATVARWIAAAREGLLDRTTALLGERLRLPPAELASLLEVVRSSLDLSVQALLAERAG